MSTIEQSETPGTHADRVCVTASCAASPVMTSETACPDCGGATQRRDAGSAAPIPLAIEAPSLETPVAATSMCSRCRSVHQGGSLGPCRESAPSTSPMGEARFVGSAMPLGGVPISRLLNAACYIIAGIASLILSSQPQVGGWAVALGLAAIAYGIKIVITKTSYWVSSAVYVVAIFSVLAAMGALTQ